MRTLVTGLSGFTGFYVKAELEKHGHSVHELESDLRDYDALIKEMTTLKPEAVVHLAAVAFVGHANSNAFYDVNLIGTRNLLDAIAQTVPNIQSVLLASSANIYGNRSEGVLSETTLPDPANDYAVSKYAMEQMARLWFDQLPIFIVRPFNYTGVGQHERFLIPKIVSHFSNKKSLIELGNLEVWREFGDVRMVADIYRRLLEACPAGNTLNVCTSQSHSLLEVVKLCETLSGRSIEIQVNPAFVRANEIRTLMGCNQQLKKTIGGWQSYTLKETLQWMLEH